VTHPTPTAPANSITVVILMACSSVIDLEETEVAKLFTTSLAPSGSLADDPPDSTVDWNLMKSSTTYRYSTHREKRISSLSQKYTRSNVGFNLLNITEERLVVLTSK
jgi:hypothetical protein